MPAFIFAHELNTFKGTKTDLFADLPHAFDFTLPQAWLNWFSEFCRVRARFDHLTYDKIRFLTVWAYPDGNAVGRPYSICAEIAEAIAASEAIR